MNSNFWGQEFREGFEDLALVILLGYGSVCWVSLLGALT